MPRLTTNKLSGRLMPIGTVDNRYSGCRYSTRAPHWAAEAALRTPLTKEPCLYSKGRYKSGGAPPQIFGGSSLNRETFYSNFTLNDWFASFLACLPVFWHVFPMFDSVCKSVHLWLLSQKQDTSIRAVVITTTMTVKASEMPKPAVTEHTFSNSVKCSINDITNSTI